MRDGHDCAFAEQITNCLLNCKEGGKHVKLTIKLRQCAMVKIVQSLNESRIVFLTGKKEEGMLN